MQSEVSGVKLDNIPILCPFSLSDFIKFSKS